MKKLFGQILCVIAAVMLAGCASVVRDRIYQPSALSDTPVSFVGSAPRDVSVTTADGMVLQGYYWAPTGPARDLVVYFHGNGFNQLVGAARAEPLTGGGHGVLVASYRGYGGNPGSPSEDGLFADGDAWMAKAEELVPDGRRFVFGHSLGGAIALEMAGRHDVDGVATLGAFSSLSAVAPAVARGLLPDQYDNLSAIGRVTAPVFLFHGTDDETVPFAEGEKLAALGAGRGNVTLLPLPSGKHHVAMDKLAPFVWKAFETGKLDPAELD